MTSFTCNVNLCGNSSSKASSVGRRVTGKRKSPPAAAAAVLQQSELRKPAEPTGSLLLQQQRCSESGFPVQMLFLPIPLTPNSCVNTPSLSNSREKRIESRSTCRYSCSFQCRSLWWDQSLDPRILTGHMINSASDSSALQ